MVNRSVYVMILYIIICLHQEHALNCARLNGWWTSFVFHKSPAHLQGFFTHQEIANRNKRQCRALISRLQGTLMRLYCADRHLSDESLFLPIPPPSPPISNATCARLFSASTSVVVVLRPRVGIGSGSVGLLVGWMLLLVLLFIPLQ